MAAMADLAPGRVTMAEVARRAGVSRMTVYRRYDSLDAVVSAALTAEMAAVVAAVADGVPRDGTARERVVAEAAGTVAALVEHTLLQRVLEVDPASLLPLLVERLGAGQQLLREFLAAEVELGIAPRGGDGSIRAADPRLLSLTVLTMCQQFVVGMRPLREEFADRQLIAELERAVDRYLAPDAAASQPHSASDTARTKPHREATP